MSPEQQRMAAAHGTPAQFTRAVLDAIGEISVDEAIQAIEKYQQEWRNAAPESEGDSER